MMRAYWLLNGRSEAAVQLVCVNCGEKIQDDTRAVCGKESPTTTGLPQVAHGFPLADEGYRSWSCSQCGLLNFNAATECTCGHLFASRQAEAQSRPSTAKASSRSHNITQIAALGFSAGALILSSMIFMQWSVRGGNPRSEQGLSPAQVFYNVSSSVFVVEVVDESGQVTRFGSGVAIEPTRIITNKHVVLGADSLRVRQGQMSWPARLLRSHPDEDLSELDVSGLYATYVPFRAEADLVNVGERAYAIGAPQALELTLSEGIVSNTWNEDGLRLIQTTAAISQGSSGGGLFDSNGLLIGITTSSLQDGQNLNFAVPVEAIRSLSEIEVRSDSAPSSPVEKNRPNVPLHDSAYDELMRIGDDAYEEQEFRKAAAAYSLAAEKKPDDYEAHHYTGLVYSHLGDRAKAREHLKQFVMLAPDDDPDIEEVLRWLYSEAEK